MSIKPLNIMDIPNEILFKVFEELDHKDMQAIMATSHKLKNLGNVLFSIDPRFILKGRIISQSSLAPLVHEIATNVGKNLQINIVPLDHLLTLDFRIIKQYLIDKNPLMQLKKEQDIETRTTYLTGNSFFKIAIEHRKHKGKKPKIVNFAYEFSPEEECEFRTRMEIETSMNSRRRGKTSYIKNGLTEKLDIAIYTFMFLNKIN